MSIEIIPVPDDKTWIPHRRESWPFVYMTTMVPMSLNIWNGNWPVCDNTAEKPLPVGTRVRIVMVSRFGDVGITDDLSAKHGYYKRIDIDQLSAMFTNFSKEP